MLLNPAWEKQALSKPSLKALSHILRNRELWPQGFIWDYRNCNHCAMGMAVELWFKAKMLEVDVGLIADQLDLEFEVAEAIFLNLWSNKSLLVTPEMVADEIDRWT